MKRSVVVLFICLSFFSSVAFAQTVKIIDVKGDVSFKKTAQGDWEKAKVNTFLDKDAQIKTGPDSKCTLIFDDAMKNVLTLKENSQITLLAVKPVNIELPRGKVFVLVDDIKKVEKFEIRTPNAVAGVRGTGEAVESNNDKTTVMCFKDIVNIQGVDPNGNFQGIIDLLAGLGIIVSPDGTLSGTYPLTEEDLKLWEEFLDYVDDIKGSIDEANTSSEEVKGEGQQDHKGDLFEEDRGAEEQRPREDSGDDENKDGYEGGEGGYDGGEGGEYQY